MIKTAEDFIAKRALTHIGSITPQPVVHIVKVGAGDHVLSMHWWCNSMLHAVAAAAGC